MTREMASAVVAGGVVRVVNSQSYPRCPRPEQSATLLILAKTGQFADTRFLNTPLEVNSLKQPGTARLTSG